MAKVRGAGAARGLSLQRMLAAGAAAVLIATLVPWAPVSAQAPAQVNFWFPVDLGGGLANVIQTLVAEFNQTHPGIHVTASYTGSYDAEWQKIQAAQLAGNLPDVAMVENGQTQQLGPTGLVADLAPFVAQAGGTAYLGRFMPGMFLNSYYAGKLYALPFQRSVPVLYYNKDLLKAAGIARPPATWAEFIADAQKLTVRRGNTITRWGAEFPLDPFDWIVWALIYQSGGQVMSLDLKHLYMNQPPAIEAMQFWYDLVNKYRVMPAYTPWNQGAQDFVAQTTAMVMHSSGSIAFFRQSAKFAWGLTRLPMNKRYGINPGGGNFVIFKKASAQQQAAWTFASWMVEPRQTAYWSINSGYIAVMKDAWDLPEMKRLVQEQPEVLATIDSLKNAYYEPAAPNWPPVRDLIHDTVQDILANKVPLRQGLETITTKGDALLSQAP
jgi:sn-glycerol 3-phosphate transport system substrate-binding protein